MKKIVVSAIIWGGLWAAGLFLSAGRGTKVDEWSFFITPMVLATAIVVWGVISAKGGLGTIAGMIIGLCLAVGTFFSFILLSVLVQKELIGEGHMARDIAKLMVGGIIGGIAGACSEMGRQGLLRKE